LVASAAQTARAQALARLTVESFELSSDTAQPRIDVPFHLILTLHIRERVPVIANLNLPMLAQLELLGDERETIATPRGTQYRETIGVVAHEPGTLAIAPATLQAIDARDGKPKEWYTNALTLRVAGTGSHVLRNGAELLLSGARRAIRMLLLVLALGCIAAVALLLLRGQQPRVAVVPPQHSGPLVVVRSSREQARDALILLRAERTRAAAVRVRAAIWRMVGASDGETLGDVLRRPESSNGTMRELLVALERSAFTYDGDLRGAIDDACSSLERYIGSAA
jgi:hypothetical protein